MTSSTTDSMRTIAQSSVTPQAGNSNDCHPPALPSTEGPDLSTTPPTAEPTSRSDAVLNVCGSSELVENAAVTTDCNPQRGGRPRNRYVFDADDEDDEDFHDDEALEAQLAEIVAAVKSLKDLSLKITREMGNLPDPDSCSLPPPSTDHIKRLRRI